MNKYAQDNKRISKGIKVLTDEGLFKFAVKTLKYLKRASLRTFSPIIIALKPKKIFLFQNNSYKYFYHKTNLTWTNERAVEIPIIMKYLRNASDDNA